jgi:hypothetical protein
MHGAKQHGSCMKVQACLMSGTDDKRRDKHTRTTPLRKSLLVLVPVRSAPVRSIAPQSWTNAAAAFVMMSVLSSCLYPPDRSEVPAILLSFNGRYGSTDDSTEAKKQGSSDDANTGVASLM